MIRAADKSICHQKIRWNEEAQKIVALGWIFMNAVKIDPHYSRIHLQLANPDPPTSMALPLLEMAFKVEGFEI